MAKRPTLTTQSFLAHIFSPKKNPLPTGLRARPIALTKGRKAARVNSYNKLPAVKQEVIKRSGLREKFLRGEVSFTDARKTLREQAVKASIVKPLRTPKPKKMSLSRARQGYIAQYLLNTLRSAGKTPRVPTVYAGSQFIEEDDVETLTYSQIAERARDERYVVTLNGERFNPYWYN